MEIDLSALGRIDLTGMLALRSVVEDFATRFEIDVVNVPPTARRLVERVLPRGESAAERARRIS